MKKVISTTSAPAAIGPYSQAVETGNMIFLSGQLPIDPKTGIMPEGIKAQTRQSFANIKAILAEAGYSVEHIVKTTVLLADMSLFGEMNEIYAVFPSLSAFAVKELPKQALVEIEVIAVKA